MYKEIYLHILQVKWKMYILYIMDDFFQSFHYLKLFGIFSVAYFEFGSEQEISIVNENNTRNDKNAFIQSEKKTTNKILLFKSSFYKIS